MKIAILLLYVGLVSSAHALFDFTREAMHNLVFRQISLSCKCKDRFSICPYLQTKCVNTRMMKFMCPVSCGVCTECDPPGPPTLFPPVDPCDENCGDKFDLAVCEYYSGKDQCMFFSNMCRATCGLCRPCALPPITPHPCQQDCANIKDERTCSFWQREGFCTADHAYSADVRYMCQRTCEVCRPCTFEKLIPGL